MHVESWQANPVGIGEPCAFAGPGPAVLAGNVGGVFGLGCLELAAGPVKSDADWRAGGQGEHSGPELTMQVNNQIVISAPKLGEQFDRPQRRRPRAAKSREVLAGEENHVREVG